MTTIDLEQQVYSALNRRKYLTLKQKKSMLSTLCEHEFGIKKIDNYIELIRKSKESSWTESFTARRIAEVFAVYKDLASIRPRNAALKALKTSMVQVQDALDQWQSHQDSEEGKRTRTSLNYQRYGNRMQDTIPFQSSQVDHMPCVNCGHKSIMALEPAEEVNEKNAAATASYNAKMAKWSSQPESTRRGNQEGQGFSCSFLDFSASK